MIKELREYVEKYKYATLRAQQCVEEYWPEDIETISFHKGGHKAYKHIFEHIEKIIQSHEKR